MRNLQNKSVAILATDGYEKSELFEPLKKLRDAGARVDVLSLEHGEIRSWDTDRWDEAIKVDRTLDEAMASDYDALVLPGGQINPDLLRVEEKAVAFVRDFHATGRPLAAICHAPWLLIEAGLVDGLRATSYKSIRTDMINAGARWADEEVIVDNGIITSRNPGDLDAFCDCIADEVAEGSTATPDAA